MKRRGRRGRRRRRRRRPNKGMDFWVFVWNHVYFGFLGFLVWIIGPLYGLLDLYMDFHGSWVFDLVPKARV